MNRPYVTNLSFQNIDKKTAIKILVSAYEAKNKFERFFEDKSENIHIITFDTWDSYTTALRDKKPTWAVTANKDAVVHIYNPRKWHIMKTGHSINDLTPSILHELVHVYFKKQKINLLPIFEEGIAQYISGKKGVKRRNYKYLLKKSQLPNLLENQLEFKQHEIPALSYLASHEYISMLAKMFGLKKLKHFFINIKEKNNFDLLFKEIFAISPTESWKIFIEKNNYE